MQISADSELLKIWKGHFLYSGVGQAIWVYNLDSKYFTRIDIDKPERLQIKVQLWVKEDALYSVPWQLPSQGRFRC